MNCAIPRVVSESCMVEFIIIDCGRVVTELEEYLCELLFSLTQLSELNSVFLVVTKDTLVK